MQSPLPTPTPQTPPTPPTGASTEGMGASVLALERARVQKEMASAIWAMSKENVENQIAIAHEGGIPPLIALLEGHPEVQCDVAGALWSLAANAENPVHGRQCL